MATQVSIHWVGYTVLAGALAVGGWLWHDTQVRDAKQLAQVAQVKQAQAVVDQQAGLKDKQALADLAAKNAALQKQLAQAKTAKQQATLINQQTGTHIEVPEPTTPSQKPSNNATLPQSDLPILAKRTVDFEAAQNQVAADEIQIAEDKDQIAVRDTRIEAQDKEITTLQGGSHLKRFFTATKHVAIGVAAGVVIGYLAHGK